MGHLHAVALQQRCPCLGRAGRSEDDFYRFLEDDVDDFLHLGVKQGDIDAEGAVGCGFALADMMPEVFRMERTGPDKPEAAAVAYGGSQAPSAAPDHAALHNRVSDAE